MPPLSPFHSLLPILSAVCVVEDNDEGMLLAVLWPNSAFIVAHAFVTHSSRICQVEAASATIVATGHSTAFAGGVAHSSDNGGLAGTPDGHGVRDATAGCSVDGTVVPLSGVPVLCPAPAVNVHPDDGCGGVREHVDQKVNQGVVRDCGCETGSFDEVGLVTDGPEAGLPHSRSKKHQEVGKPPSGVVSKPGIQRLNKSSQLRNMVSDAIKLPVKARNDEESNPQEVGVVSVKLELGTENGQPRLAEKLKRQVSVDVCVFGRSH